MPLWYYKTCRVTVVPIQLYWRLKMWVDSIDDVHVLYTYLVRKASNKIIQPYTCILSFYCWKWGWFPEDIIVYWDGYAFREAARECRRKKKEYVRCLENRVAVLESQNQALIGELRALKELYLPKSQDWLNAVECFYCLYFHSFILFCTCRTEQWLTSMFL